MIMYNEECFGAHTDKFLKLFSGSPLRHKLFLALKAQ